MGVTFDLDSKEMVLHFIQHSQFRKAPNPGIHILKSYQQRTKSTIQWDDFKRVLHELVNDECLELSTGPHGEDCYFLLNEQKKKQWYKSTEIWIKIIGLSAGLLGLIKVLIG